MGSDIHKNFMTDGQERFFEKVIFGKDYLKAPMITSRICSDSSFANSIAACKAIEQACQIHPSKQTGVLREIVLSAEIIKSHTKNLYEKVLPIFLGSDDNFHTDIDNLNFLRNMRTLKNFSCRVLESISGRGLHPITIVPGGFTKFPETDELSSLLDLAAESHEAAERTIALFASFDYPKTTQKMIFTALHDKDGYPLFSRTIRMSNGFDFEEENWNRNILEEQLPHHGMKAASMNGYNAVTGPLARILLNKHLHKEASEIAKKLQISFSFKNPFETILAQALEIQHFVLAIETTIKKLLDSGIKHELPTVPKKFGSGGSACESADGTVFHRYEISEDGLISRAEIITPANINLIVIEKCLKTMDEKSKSNHDEKKKILNLLLSSYGFCEKCARH